MRAALAKRRAGLWRFLTHDWSKVRAHAIRDAEVSPRQRSYPVAILRGGASAEVVNYSTLAEDLASHGYVVVGVDAPARTGLVVFPDGRTIERTPQNNPELCVDPRCYERLLAAWTSDIGFVLDRLARLDGKFAGRLDLTRAGVFGHSFGGAQAAQFCSQDPRCKAGIDVDGLLLGSVVQTGIHKPFMFLLSDHSRESGSESARVKADIRSVYDRLPPAGRRYVVLRGANHFAFSDDGAVLKSGLVRAVLRIDGRGQLAATADAIRKFFDAYL
jgi:pimeloyl-ACP methyl ester carboxylesterase